MQGNSLDTRDPQFLKFLLDAGYFLFIAPIAYLWKQVTDLKEDHYETKVHAAQIYVTQEQYEKDRDRLEYKVDKILDKLGDKADR